nr:imidazolonepropionase [Pseudopedobacter sp.]
IDCHTHICYVGSRAADYAMRISGKSYLEIAHSGGGIWDTVTQTRSATEDELVQLIAKRVLLHLQQGVTTIEVKSGYGLSMEEELKQLRAIKVANEQTEADLISTCLAMHMKPKDFEGSSTDYLNFIQKGLWPILKAENLTHRLDIFIEKSAFTTNEGEIYLKKAKKEGFKFTVHADQFTSGGSEVAVNCNALSADHLEASNAEDIERLSNADTVAVVLPGASLGLGLNYAPARRLLDAGCCVAIASDWNPGSAPMGNLLLQAAVMGAAEKLSCAETFAGLTYRAAKALNLNDRGSLKAGSLADFQAFSTKDYRDILYYQGSLMPTKVWKNGNSITK